ncbi:uncharacterized protein [Diadema antillarum]|uniref:uncharacterized protein n=1 Tax=Diadema antillarum TaxID=105358 RepID=UPI003A87A045
MKTLRTLLHCTCVIIVLAAVFPGETQACFCPAVADESKICMADFAIKVEILSQDQNRINGTVSEVFKNSSRSLPQVKRGSDLTLAKSTHVCGQVDVQVGSTYFISGKAEHGRPLVHKCASVIGEYGDDGVPYRGDLAIDVNPDCDSHGSDNKPIKTQADGSGHVFNLSILLLTCSLIATLF